MLYSVDNLPPIHPGNFLRDELEALNISARRFAKKRSVSPACCCGCSRVNRRSWD